MATWPINQLPTPTDSSPNSPPIHFDALAQQLDSRLVPRFASATARDAAITSPVAGQVCAVGSQMQEYVAGPGWIALMPSIFSTSLDGTVAPVGAKFVQYIGTTTVTTTSTGGFNINLPVTFSKIICVIPGAGDTAGNLSSWVVNGITSTTINGRADSATGPGVGGVQTIRVNFIVIGWL